MRWWRKTSVGLKVAIIATVVLALSVVGVLAAERFDNSRQDDAVKARETGTSTPKPGEEIKFRGKPLELGTVAKISSNYRVAVTELSRYEIPSGQLLAATIDATYIGRDDGEPWADLDAEFFAKAGSPAFGESDCPAALNRTDPSEQPALKTGDEMTYSVCVELPDTDLTKGRVSVQEAFSTGARISWSTEEAVTKALPSVAPGAAAQAPVTRPQPAQRSNDDEGSKDQCEDWDEEEYEEYKEYGDQRKKQFEEYRDAGGDNEDLIDDYEDWEEDYDKQMDFLDKYAEAC